MLMKMELFSLIHSPILGRRYAGKPPKGAGKVILIRKAAGFRNFRNGFIGEVQQLFRPVDANSQHKLYRRHTGNLFEYPRKMWLAHIAKHGTF